MKTMRDLINLIEANQQTQQSLNQKNAEYHQTHYTQPVDDTDFEDDTFGDSTAYQNYKSRKHSAYQNKLDNAKRDAQFKGSMSAETQHTSPIAISQEEWNRWVRDNGGSLDAARQVDIQAMKARGMNTQNRAAKSKSFAETVNDMFGDEEQYQDYKTSTGTERQNRLNKASGDASYAAKMAAHSQHSSPVYSTPEQWNFWVRQGGLNYARQMDLDRAPQ